MANEQAKAFIDQATQSLQNSQFQQALDLIDQAIAIEPGATDSFVLRGICLSQLDQPDAATEAFRKAIMLSPYNSKAYYNLAVHQNALGNKKEAAELAKEAIGVDPRHAGARQFLSQLEQELAGVSPIDPAAAQQDLTNPHDPLSAAKPTPPPSPDGGPPPSGTGVAPPVQPSAPPTASAQRPPEPIRQPGSTAPANANPYAGQTSQSQFSQRGYTRPGYQEPTSALPWVSNMGNGWLVIGIFIAVLSLVYWLGSISLVLAFFNGQSAGSMDSLMTGGVAMRAIGFLAAVLSVLWMICDVLDRRSSWWWLLLIVPGACCCLNFIGMPIYMLAGRKRG